MSGFLQALVGRTLGTMSVVAPRRRSRFEPGSAGRSGGFDERDETHERSAAAPAADRNPPAAASPPVARTVIVRRAADPVSRPAASDAAESRPTISGAVPAAVAARESFTAAREPSRTPPRDDTPGFVGPKSATVPGREPRVAPLLRRDDRAALRRERRESAPAVHVTIGRVEVRAIHRDEARRTPAKPAEPPKQPLGDYLRQRRD